MAEKTVRTGMLDACPNQNVETLINGKIKNAQWDNFLSKETNEYIVSVRGQVSVLNETSPIHMQFAVDGENFEIRFLELDGEPQDENGISEFVSYLCGFYDEQITEIQNQESSDHNQDYTVTNTQTETEETYTSDGMYQFEDESCFISFSIFGDTWQSEFILKTGLGSDYDSENSEFDGGIVNNNSLFEESGNIEIGHIHGNTLITTIGGRTVTLKKIPK